MSNIWSFDGGISLLGLNTLGKRSLRPVRNAAIRRWPVLGQIKRYHDVFGRYPNLIRPRAFSEKVLCKMFFDRDPMLPLYADKYRVRDYVSGRCPDKGLLTQIYHVVSDASEILSLALPTSFVMKANHLSGQVEIVREGSLVDHEYLADVAAKWLRRNYYSAYAEWAYRSISPCVYFEELLGTGEEPPIDYKFYCFDGEPQFISVHQGRGIAHKRNFYDSKWKLLPFTAIRANIPGILPVPVELPQMLAVSAALSRGIDFIRVDLYDIDGRIVFGELTNYPGSGLLRCEPDEWDMKMGESWRTLGWRK